MPGCCGCHHVNHVIKAFLDKTSLEQSVDGKQLRVDFYSLSEAKEPANHEKAVTWILHARVRLHCDRNFSNVLADHKDRQKNMPQGSNVDCVCVFRCFGQGSKHMGTKPVQILLHGTSGTLLDRAL